MDIIADLKLVFYRLKIFFWFYFLKSRESMFSVQVKIGRLSEMRFFSSKYFWDPNIQNIQNIQNVQNIRNIQPESSFVYRWSWKAYTGL